MFKIMSHFLAAVGLIVVLGVTSGQAATIGNPAVAGSTTDGFDDFALLHGDMELPTGVITDWEVYATGVSGGRIGLIVWELVSGITYRIKALDIRDVSTTGKHVFSGVSISVREGDFLGTFFDGSRVQFSYGGPANAWNANLTYASVDPAVGDVVTLNSPGAGAGVNSPVRTYSVNATVGAVPLPAGFVLMLSGALGLVVLRSARVTAR